DARRIALPREHLAERERALRGFVLRRGLRGAAQRVDRRQARGAGTGAARAGTQREHEPERKPLHHGPHGAFSSRSGLMPMRWRNSWSASCTHLRNAGYSAAGILSRVSSSSARVLIAPPSAESATRSVPNAELASPPLGSCTGIMPFGSCTARSSR